MRLVKKLTVNPEPMEVRPTRPICRKCRKESPWCSCGAMDYDIDPRTLPVDPRVKGLCAYCSRSIEECEAMGSGYCCSDCDHSETATVERSQDR